ncbi:hypothetical protein GCM10018793_05820 [Streptomyces sulfonofaciens]|uniref:RNA helicase n=1 Tax=Streptomyces sulfonofaciens TaxID=68272 RepID=A0A919FRH2_9ACTN|nr:DEAD/DEAH box helicase [Streptomyces sulfonofaciens]GHH70943.1 hypothetical protein GCM10018793_05820 [Streptomyces sulfonofaciens]
MSVSIPDHVAVSESRSDAIDAPGAADAADAVDMAGAADVADVTGELDVAGVPDATDVTDVTDGTTEADARSETRSYDEAAGTEAAATDEVGEAADSESARNDGAPAPSDGPAPSDEPAAPTFADLGLPDAVVRKLAQNGVTTPFPIQAATIPDALAGRDILGRGRTGSGKTLSFGLPLLTTLAGGYTEKKHPRGVILTPTRELAMQVADALQPYGDVLGLKMKVVCGGTSMGNQIYALERGVDILVATPGRLRDLIGRGACSLSSVQVAVLDEADQMADLGFLPEVTELLDQVPEGGQRMLFSATLDHDIDTLIKRYLNAPVTHEVDPSAGAVTTMSHHILIVKPRDKAPVTAAIASRKGRTIVFVRTQMGADRIAEQLRDAGVRADALHGGMTQGARTRTLADFKDGYVNVLVATDVAARGIHVDDVDLVLNVDPAGDHKDYLHRSGRTARAGRSGTVVSLALPHQRRQMFRLMEDAGVDAARHIVGGGGVFDPAVAEITGARSMTEVQAESAGRAAEQAEREVKDLTKELERAQRRAVELREEADHLTLRAARERGEEPPRAASGAHSPSGAASEPAGAAPAGAAPAETVSAGTAPAAPVPPVASAEAAAPAAESGATQGGTAAEPSEDTAEAADASSAETMLTVASDGSVTQTPSSQPPVSVPRQSGPQDADRAAGTDRRTGGFGGRDRDRDRDGGRGFDRDRGGRSYERRDGERAGRSFDRRDDRRDGGRDDRGGYRRDDRASGGFRRDDRGGRSFDRREQGGNRSWDRDRGTAGRDRDGERGGFGGRDRDRDRDGGRGFDRDRGGRSYERRDGERAGRSFDRRDDRRDGGRDDRGGYRRDDRTSGGFRRDGDRPGHGRDSRPAFGRDRDRDRDRPGFDRDRNRDGDRGGFGGRDRDGDRPRFSRDRDRGDRPGFRHDDRGGHRGSDRPYNRDRRDDRPSGDRPAGGHRSGGYRPGGHDRPGARRDDHRGGGTGSASGGGAGAHRRREDKPRWKRNG